jgi:hypothetical protein
MLRRVAFVRIGVSEELSSSIFRVTRIDELGTKLAITSMNSFYSVEVTYLQVTESFLSVWYFALLRCADLTCAFYS